MTDCRLPECVRPAGSAYICTTCTGVFRRKLADVPWLVDELATSYTRQTRYGSGGGGARHYGATAPLLYDDRASKGLTRLTAALTAAVESLARPEGPRPGPGAEPAAQWLQKRCNDLRRNTAGADHVVAIQDAIRAARGAVDRPADRWFAGPCWGEVDVDDRHPDGLCGVDLYARAGSLTVTCRHCGSEYDVKSRRAWLLKSAEDQWLDAADLARAVSWLGAQPLSADRIYKWKQRGRITHARRRCTNCHRRPVVRPCPMDTPLYRVGDAIDLLAQAADRAAKRAAVTSAT